MLRVGHERDADAVGQVGLVLVRVLDGQHVVLLAPQHEGRLRHRLDELLVDLHLVAAALEEGAQRLPPRVLGRPEVRVRQQPVGRAPLEEVGDGVGGERREERAGLRVRLAARVHQDERLDALGVALGEVHRDSAAERRAEEHHLLPVELPLPEGVLVLGDEVPRRGALLDLAQERLPRREAARPPLHGLDAQPRLEQRRHDVPELEHARVEAVDEHDRRRVGELGRCL